MEARALQRAHPGLSARRAQQLVGPCNEAMLKAGITTRRRAAYFHAQIGHESVSLHYKAEIGGSRTRYAPYYGRGFIQLTWKSNYMAFGHWLGKGGAFVRDPGLVERDDYAWLSAVYYWSSHNLNAYCDKGDFRGLTRAINGGYNGLADRERRLRITSGLGDSILPKPRDVLGEDERYHVDRSRQHGIELHRAERIYVWLSGRANRIKARARAGGKGGWSRENRSARFQVLQKARAALKRRIDKARRR